jgi:hypothetical protein
VSGKYCSINVDYPSYYNSTTDYHYFHRISRGKSKSADNQVHFFTSHFFTTITEEGPEGVKSWTQNEKRTIPVFEKKFVFRLAVSLTN